MENIAFTTARAVWPEGLDDAMNVTVVFETRFDFSAAKNAILRLACAQVCRIHVNGAFAGYGPARAPKGFARVDEWDLSPFLREGENEVAVEVASYRCYNYYLPNVPGFLRAEVVVDGAVVAATPDGFRARLAPRVRRTPRYSYQRPFTESWRLPAAEGAGEAAGLRLVTSAYGESVELLPRRADYPDLSAGEPFRPLAELGCHFADAPEKRDFWWMKPEGEPFVRYGLAELEDDLADDLLRLRVVRESCAAEGEAAGWSRSCATAAGGIPTPQEGVPLAAGSGRLFDGGGNRTGFVMLKLRVDEAPARLLATFDEVLGKDGLVDPWRNNSANIVAWEFSRPGEYEVETFEPYTFRFLELLCVRGRVTAAPPRLRDYSCPSATHARPALGDGALDAIFEAARETFAQNAVDVFTDCPGRERAGWLCDSFWTARTSWLLTGSNALETLFLENFAVPGTFEWIPDGMLPMCWPSDHPTGGFIPNWAMWFVIELEEYARLRDGDPALVERLRPRVIKLLDHLRTFANEDGLLENLPSWVFVEWSHANALTKGVNYPSNATWAGTLDAAARLYGLPALSDEAGRVREAVRRQSFDGEWFHDQALRGKDGALSLVPDRTETCQYYAFYFGVATPETHSALWRRLAGEFGPDRAATGRHPEIWPANAFIGNYLRLELLSRAGLRRQIADEIRGYFAYMAEQTGTLWENVSSAASCCHGFASHVAVVLARDVAGEGGGAGGLQ